MDKITHTGVSLLIPIYNQNVTLLVKKLYKQAKKLNSPFEILCFDDCSQPKYKEKNKELANLIGVNYMELSENLGRAKIRNWLVKSAAFEYLIFLDGDSKIMSDNFIKNYLQHAKENVILAGGRNYLTKAPNAKSKKLHWLYGTKNESKPASFRNKNPHNFFHSNNFFCPRNILITNPFEEQIDGYGYEDLLMAYQIKDQGIKIIHIDNPIEHLGLETNKIFIDKSIQAIKNLASINQERRIIKTSLVEAVTILRDWGLEKFFMRYALRNHEKWHSNLLSDSPNINHFQLLKLYHYLTENPHKDW